MSELTTIGEVHVERYNYPTTTSGGWAGNAVAPGTLGGYEWYVWFVKNPGTKDGYSFHLALEILILSLWTIRIYLAHQLQLALYSILTALRPSTVLTVTLDGVTSDPIEYDQSAIETKYLIESMSNVGTVTTSTQYRYMEEIPGVYATVDRDSNVAYITYASNDTERPTDIRQFLAPGDTFRIGGGDNNMDPTNQASIDGATLVDSASVDPGSPVFTVSGSAATVLPGETVRVGADEYSVLRTGVEVQVISISCESGEVLWASLSF